MALLIGLPIRRCRLKIPNFTQLTRNYNTSTPINRTIGRRDKIWYFIGGSLIAIAYAKWYRTSPVQAFNPKKLKVSAKKNGTTTMKRRRRRRVWQW